MTSPLFIRRTTTRWAWSISKYGVEPPAVELLPSPQPKAQQKQKQKQQMAPPPPVAKAEMCIDKLWGQLNAEQRAAAEALKWTQQTWNDGVCPVKFWTELSHAEKQAAKALGFGKRSWDTLGLDDGGSVDEAGGAAVAASNSSSAGGLSDSASSVHDRLYRKPLGGSLPHSKSKKGASVVVPSPRKVGSKPGAPRLTASARKAKLEFVAARST
eukprot:COSAG05_NODE_1690_length_4271_cov_1.395254_4_plen_213_part_00